MSNNRISRIKQQLGMSPGTATNRLRKNLMFKFAQELGYDKCFVCGELIEKPEDLSIEHKEPWENRPNGEKLFWDLNNIAFSHRECNIPHIQRNGYSNRYENRPNGTAWCSGHNKYLPIDYFHKADRANGCKSYCKECAKVREKNRKQGLRS